MCKKFTPLLVLILVYVVLEEKIIYLRGDIIDKSEFLTLCLHILKFIIYWSNLVV